MKRPSLFTKDKIALFLAEIVVVVVGILIAFQVEEWRDRLAERREVDAALTRLMEETEINRRLCDDGTERGSALVANGALTVLKVLNAERLTDADSEEFNWGLATVGFNPRPPFFSTVAEEMISTGLLKNIDDQRIRQSIAAMVTAHNQIDELYSNWNTNLQAAADELNRTIEIRYTGATVLSELQPVAGFEQGIETHYDFQALLQNTYLKNLLIEATDVHIDRHLVYADMCSILAEIERALGDSAR